MTGGNPAGRMTLGRHIVECQRRHPAASGELSVLLIQLALAGKVFSHALRKAAISGDLGSTGERNIQGEATMKLDVFGNETLQREPGQRAGLAGGAASVRAPPHQ